MPGIKKAPEGRFLSKLIRSGIITAREQMRYWWSAWYQRARNHDHNVAFLCQTAFNQLQSHFFTQTVEIISRGDLFHQVWNTPLLSTS
jgi:hypothetical protein